MNKIDKVKRRIPLRFIEAEQNKEFNEERSLVIKALKPKGQDYLLNSIYRDTPYDLNNIDDLIDAIERTFCEYMDICHYYSEIFSIIENYDETFELYNPKEWIKENNPKNLYHKARNLAIKTECAFNKLVELKEEEFLFLIETALVLQNNKINKMLFHNESVIVKDIELFINWLEVGLQHVDEMYVYECKEQLDKLTVLMCNGLESCK
ncbi:MAG: hypothetical protein M0Q88_02930 [Bacilli bacterium]|nr:hypothetical protein [Bacilli bacterium]